MRPRRFSLLYFLTIIILLASLLCAAETVSFNLEEENGIKVFRLKNEKIGCAIFFTEARLEKDSYTALSRWVAAFNRPQFTITTSADFVLNVMWTGWRAPGEENNAANPVLFSKKDFKLEDYKLRELPGEIKELDLLFRHRSPQYVHLEIRLTYRLEPESFFVRRKVSVRDRSHGDHFLRWLWPLRAEIQGKTSIVKRGGFGQPAALRTSKGGVFFGLEYPASENSLEKISKKITEIQCGQEMGEIIRDSWLESEWVVTGLAPEPYLKRWFFLYLDRIRVAEIRPYLLYNSWYDLRAPEYVENEERAMTEKNVLRTIEIFRHRLYQERGLSLDAFVLDDGWDVYRSDWKLSPNQFPRGFTPVVDALKSMGTELGLWLGPIGGYSHREWRVGWMREHGYETVGSQMCVAGKNYSKLLKKRVVDFARNDKVRYYKWDGIQFSCSEPDHGHLPGIYSRRQVMESVTEMCRAVRKVSKDMFLNITSGTWLSPWWLKYANTIWMQGGDYGYADVPSISRRDQAITYRDSILYEGLKKMDAWFPVANLMTHGIIKGHLQMLGGKREPLDKFVDNSLLYFARGPSMWELYISPDLLSESEWDALAAAIKWARDRFSVLNSTWMAGGDPDERKAYAYLHFKEKRGIIACRNPYIEPQTLRVELSPSWGLDPEASSLVVERVYPTRMILPGLKKSGSRLNIPLQGYETAIFELYPLEEAREPLLAGVRFDVLSSEKGRRMVLYEVEKPPLLLNPEIVEKVFIAGKEYKPGKLSLPLSKRLEPVKNVSFSEFDERNKSTINIHFDLEEFTTDAFLALLLERGERALSDKDPEVEIYVDGEKVLPGVVRRKGKWGWYLVNVRYGKRSAQVQIKPPRGMSEWRGKASVWVVCLVESKATEVFLETGSENLIFRPMPPRPWPPGFSRRNVKLGEVEVDLSLKK